MIRKKGTLEDARPARARSLCVCLFLSPSYPSAGELSVCVCDQQRVCVREREAHKEGQREREREKERERITTGEVSSTTAFSFHPLALDFASRAIVTRLRELCSVDQHEEATCRAESRVEVREMKEREIGRRRGHRGQQYSMSSKRVSIGRQLVLMNSILSFPLLWQTKERKEEKRRNGSRAKVRTVQRRRKSADFPLASAVRRML